MNTDSSTIILLLTLGIYILILVAFNKARKKYAGGKVGDVINLILATVILLFISDYVLLLSSVVPVQTLTTIQALGRTAALSILALGGVKVAG
jgi:hypothetical protein